MKKIIKLLKKKGFVKSLQETINIVEKATDGKEKVPDIEASKYVLKMFLDRLDDDDELLEAFFEFAEDMALEAIIKELDLKAEEDYEADGEMEKLLVELAKLMFKNKKIKEERK